MINKSNQENPNFISQRVQLSDGGWVDVDVEIVEKPGDGPHDGNTLSVECRGARPGPGVTPEQTEGAKKYFLNLVCEGLVARLNRNIARQPKA